MGLFGSTSNERDVNDKGTGFQKHRIKSEFDLSLARQARAAKSAGMTIFQIDIPISKARGSSAMVGAIQSVENEGWRFDHVSCVYCMTDSISREKLPGSGREEAVSGEIIGVYIFRTSTN